MYKADYHTHSALSIDSEASLVSQIETAIARGLNEIAITDHYEYENLADSFGIYMNISEYVQQVNRCKEVYKDKITVRLGLEIGYEPPYHQALSEVIKKHPMDFVIASTHRADNMDLHTHEFFKGKPQALGYLSYFEKVLETVTLFDDFDVYGHLDYVNRYGNYENKVLDTKKYEEIVDAILEKLISKGKGLEVNTSGLRYGLGHFHPQIPILKRYLEKGGKIITVGSDSHYNAHIGYLIEEAYAMLESIGFTGYTTFENRTPIYHTFK